MVMIEISKQVAAKLERIAAREHKTLNEVAETVLDKNLTDEGIPPPVEGDIQPGTGAALLKAIREANIRGGEPDVAARSREILDKEFPDYLWRRMHESAQDESSEE